jgi:hypothetical protein
MNCSAEKASRKWPIGAFGRTRMAMVTVAALALLGMQVASAAAARRPAPSPWDALFGGGPPKRRATVHHSAVPLPKARPAEAPKPESDKPESDKAESDKPGSDQSTERAAPAATGKPAQQASPAAPEPSACRLALTEQIAIAPSIPDIHGTGGCGGEDLVRLEAIVMQDKQRVSVKPAAILRCKMATAIAEWVRSDIAPLAQSLGSTISDLDNFDSFECRGRNRVVGATLSEHGRANALDVRAFGLANGKSISLTDRTVLRDLRETVLHSVCARFSTVLGPGSDWYHEDHIHLDLMERRNNYRICQWNVYDPLPQVAPLLPAKRPEEAPPREVAAKSDAAKSETGAKLDASKSKEAEPDAAKALPAKPEPTKPQPTKKRRQNRRF